MAAFVRDVASGKISEARARGGGIPEPGGSNVLVLDSHSCQKAYAEKELIMVEFYAPWCGHCKKLALEFTKAAKALHEQSAPGSMGVTLAKVDHTKHINCGKPFKIKGYPMLYVMKRGDVTGAKRYEGERSAA